MGCSEKGERERVHYWEPNNPPGSRNVLKCKRKRRFSYYCAPEKHVYFCGWLVNGIARLCRRHRAHNVRYFHRLSPEFRRPRLFSGVADNRTLFFCRRRRRRIRRHYRILCELGKIAWNFQPRNKLKLQFIRERRFPKKSASLADVLQTVDIRESIYFLTPA